ncbi:tetratricopeptide repeat protein [Synechococcus sp. ATX 2A4]|uniref:O-linked N-acetylglucosamine transferase, SPINDLY family protein n=1 Tax=Synechococcus sp. ATX 2A4 TaxID=2823727 RepID=UPI0020CEB678|nr:tetratricopeptide repeat protein [Synechococcus sp. ATX 2A4]MCP9883869.1 tetratricopeptide repeat protein [Synechococcus sp. ATX 2A4]
MTSNEGAGAVRLRGTFQAARGLERAQRWGEAEALYRQLLQEAPAHTAALVQLANVCHRLGRAEEALQLLERALELNPQLTAAHTNRGVLLQLQGDLEGASGCYRQALSLDPGFQQAADNLAQVADQLIRSDRVEPGEQALRALLSANRNHASGLYTLGVLRLGQAQFEVARRCFERLQRCAPPQAAALFQLGQAREALGDVEGAIEAYLEALRLDPAANDVLLHLQSARLTLCDWERHHDRLQRLQRRLAAHVEHPGGAPLTPLRLLCFPLPLELQRQVATRFSETCTRSLASLPPLPPLPGGPAAPTQLAAALAKGQPRRLRLGYLSADFRDHAMGSLIHGLFAHHNRERIEVFAYALADRHDTHTASVQAGVDHYTEVFGWSNGQIAERIRNDQIDVLIDLMGHTHHSRPVVLALRPAPLQLLYLGYPGTLGASWIDGLIADHWLIPPELERGYSERVLRLPWAFVSSPPPPGLGSEAARLPGAGVSRRELGLPEQGVVFACFHRAEKLDPDRFDQWLEILRQVPGSVLWLLLERPLVRQRLRQRAAAAGIAPERLVFGELMDGARFSACCALADLFLDTAAYGAGATAVTALRAGLPLLTCPGQSFPSRMGASLLAAVGLDELITPTPQAYVQKAVALGRDPAALARLRRHLTEQQQELPLFQTDAWVRNFEAVILEQVEQVAGGIKRVEVEMIPEG